MVRRWYYKPKFVGSIPTFCTMKIKITINGKESIDEIKNIEKINGIDVIVNFAGYNNLCLLVPKYSKDYLSIENGKQIKHLHVAKNITYNICNAKVIFNF